MNNGPEDKKFDREVTRSERAEVQAAAPANNHGSDDAGFATESSDPQLEAALRLALRPEIPPAGFADRVMARALATEPQVQASNGQGKTSDPAIVHKPKLLHWPQSRLWITVAVAASLLVGIFEGGVALKHVREQQRRIVEATKQFQTTERITVHALAQAREQLQRAGVPLTLD